MDKQEAYSSLQGMSFSTLSKRMLSIFKPLWAKNRRMEVNGENMGISFS